MNRISFKPKSLIIDQPFSTFFRIFLLFTLHLSPYLFYENVQDHFEFYPSIEFSIEEVS
ncbi:hypothetical protein C2G38_2110357 [Gigaspora rosea]|uniref:Uncharacterized protein n=1 Tax=Gigaspora rosea TaxID=44941 RepID=A0A397UIY4_9GLOM|nr:hypothetical protein C2G38_2110357 [Gigaspora rosea]